jgi:hypothetical protein
MDATRYYHPSGTAPIGGILMTLLISVPAALVIGGAYGAIAWYNPFIYINCLGILVAGGACGFVVRKGLLIGRIRSRSLANSLALFVGCVGLYASWLTYFMAMLGGVLFVGPFAIWSFVVAVGAEGVWEIFGATPSGWVLYLIWLIEAAGLVLFSILVAIGEEVPYCEHCQEWTTELESKIPLPYREIEKFRAALEAEKYGGLVKQIGQPVDGKHHLTMTINACPKCSESNYLAIHESTLKEDAEDSDVNLEIGWLILNEAVVERVQQRIATSGREAIMDGLNE